MASSEKVLKSSPGMLPLFARAGAAMIPGVSRLPFLGGGEPSGGLPDLVLALEGVEVDRDRLAAYNRVCRFPLRDQLPATYAHILAFPLQLSLMTNSSFPFPALGLVHTANRIVQHRPLLIDEELDLKVWAAGLQKHPRGRQFSLRTEASVAGEVVWEETSTILKRGGASGNGDAPKERTAPSANHDDELPVTATWRLPGDLGRRYGSVSGDLNPIHIHPLTARLFGFPAAIAHGMWTKARCLAALDPRLPRSFTVEVSFRKPILLPATVQFGERAESAEIRFGVRGAGKGTPHVDGNVSFG
jgi:acyl dehydratase